MAKKNNISVAVRPSAADHGFNITVNVFLIFILIIIAIPIWCTISLSLRPANFIGSYLEGMFIPPWKLSVGAYKALLGNKGFINAFLNSFKILIMGVATALFLTVPMAYGLSVKGVPGKKWITIFVM
ncbi:MAG: carbohydrate ABC transporter permease, partial [Sphaerochaetaceae bacterium]|nr:carbohydrate ABC transporter permease [Sphaerochaetaceae bacterium]